MNAIPEVIGHSELMAGIMSQFAFMAIEDEIMVEMNFNEIFRMASEFFSPDSDELGMIETRKRDTDNRLAEFLEPWKELFDVEAMQQNIHNYLIRC